MIASYNTHDKEKEQCLLLCIVLNLGVSKLSSYHCRNFIFCTPCIGFAFVHMLAITRMLLPSVFQESAALFDTWLHHLAMIGLEFWPWSKEGQHTPGLASFPGLPQFQFLIACSMASNQKLEPGKAWERGGYTRTRLSFLHSLNPAK